jgi:CheY-like chemotaxis protein
MKKTVVAIFEDDVVNRFIYEQLFTERKENSELYIFDNAEKGIEMARAIAFDVVFVELHFWTTFGGITILKKLKEVCSPGLISIAMTALLQKGDCEYAMSSGFTMCLEKPILFKEAGLHKYF